MSLIVFFFFCFLIEFFVFVCIIYRHIFYLFLLYFYRLNVRYFSYNEENVQKYIADPYCGHFNTGGFWREFLKEMAHLWDGKNMKKVSPEEKIFIIAGEEDPVGQNGKGPKWLEKKYKALGVKDVTLKLYPHARHEIHNEDIRETVYQDILDFILK